MCSRMRWIPFSTESGWNFVPKIVWGLCDSAFDDSGSDVAAFPRKSSKHASFPAFFLQR